VTAVEATIAGAGLAVPIAGPWRTAGARLVRRLRAIAAPLKGCVAGAEGCAARTDSPSTNNEAKTAASGLSCCARSRGAGILYMIGLPRGCAGGSACRREGPAHAALVSRR